MLKNKENISKSKIPGELERTQFYFREPQGDSSINKPSKTKNNKSCSYTFSSKQNEIENKNPIGFKKKEYSNKKELIIQQFEEITKELKDNNHKKFEELEKKNEELKRENHYLENNLLEMKKKYKLLQKETKLNDSKKK